MLCNNGIHLKAVNYCCKDLHLRCLQEPWYSSALHFQKTWSRMFSKSKDFSTIKKAFQNQIFFHDERSFPQAEIFPWIKKFYTSRDLFTTKNVFLDHETFPQAKIFPLSGIFFTRNDFYIHKMLKILGTNILIL